MNKLVLINPTFTFGENAHPLCESGFEVTSKRVNCLIDTGFTLGFAFQLRSQQKFGFTNGYMVSMLLGNGNPTTGMVFLVELWVQSGESSTKLGNTSAVFLDRKGEPLMGIETLRLFSPLTFDWEKHVIVTRENFNIVS